jgi:hypothetical protein
MKRRRSISSVELLAMEQHGNAYLDIINVRDPPEYPWDLIDVAEEAREEHHRQEGHGRAEDGDTEVGSTAADYHRPRMANDCEKYK